MVNYWPLLTVGIRKVKKTSVQGVSSSITNFAGNPDETVTVAAAPI
jgi:hypothetical protein